ncbi:unnamed protein product [Symbiodinium sp. CCMP2592]|nr:unnamed protein product [Symbiodinium sp. CCMP2592]
MPKRFQRSQSADASGVRVFTEVSQEGEDCDDVLTQTALDEIRQLKNPPLAVRRTLEVMHIVLNAQRHSKGLPVQGIKWESVLRTLASDDLAEQLETYDINQLRRFPDLARDLHDFYFEEGLCFNRHKSRCSRKLQTSKSSFLRRAVTSEELKLSPGRVRYASRAAATLFAWAAKAVIEALPPPTPPMPPTPEPVLEEAEVEVLPELLLPGEAESPVQTLTAGVWATCARGHGLCVGISGTPVCAVCGNTILRGGDSASCRLCGFFVCVGCRKGTWLNISASSTSASSSLQIEVVAMRFLRDGEEPPAALAQVAQVPGAAATWSQQKLDEVQLSIRNDLVKEGGAKASISFDVQATPKVSPVPSRSGSGVFGLMDMKALNVQRLDDCIAQEAQVRTQKLQDMKRVVLQPKITQAQGKLEAAFLNQLEHVHSLLAVNDRMASVEKANGESMSILEIRVLRNYWMLSEAGDSAGKYVRFKPEQDLTDFKKAFEMEREKTFHERLESARVHTAERSFCVMLTKVRERDREQQKFKEIGNKWQQGEHGTFHSKADSTFFNMNKDMR